MITKKSFTFNSKKKKKWEKIKNNDDSAIVLRTNDLQPQEKK